MQEGGAGDEAHVEQHFYKDILANGGVEGKLQLLEDVLVLFEQLLCRQFFILVGRNNILCREGLFLQLLDALVLPLLPQLGILVQGLPDRLFPDHVLALL